MEDVVIAGEAFVELLVRQLLQGDERGVGSGSAAGRIGAEHAGGHSFAIFLAAAKAGPKNTAAAGGASLGTTGAAGPLEARWHTRTASATRAWPQGARHAGTGVGAAGDDRL